MSAKNPMRSGLFLGAMAVLLLTMAGGLFFRQEVNALKTRQGTSLQVLGQVPNFTLTERSGKEVSRADLAGKVWIADFIFTHCAGSCPTISSRMSDLQDRLRSLPDVRLVSFTVDPDRDTPAVLAEYARRYGADKDRWLFLTGKKADVYALIRGGFKLTVGPRPDGAKGQVMHSIRLALVDQKGRVRGYYDGIDPDVADKLVPAVKALLKQNP